MRNCVGPKVEGRADQEDFHAGGHHRGCHRRNAALRDRRKILRDAPKDSARSTKTAVLLFRVLPDDNHDCAKKKQKYLDAANRM